MRKSPAIESEAIYGANPQRSLQVPEQATGKQVHLGKRADGRINLMERHQRMEDDCRHIERR